MLKVNIVSKKKVKVKITKETVDQFLSDHPELPSVIKCVHLKNKPRMFLSVCLKKHFVFTDTYPECKKCKQINRFTNSILKLNRGD